MRTLIIVESPAKARTLGHLLSKDYTVKASLGHICDLPPHGMGIDVDNDLRPTPPTAYPVARCGDKMTSPANSRCHHKTRAKWLATECTWVRNEFSRQFSGQIG